MISKMTTQQIDDWFDSGQRAISLVQEYMIAPRRVLEALGDPTDIYNESDSKRSYTWYFITSDGIVISVYDYKATNLYDDNLPSPDEFWNSCKGHYIHFGASHVPHQTFEERQRVVNKFAVAMFDGDYKCAETQVAKVDDPLPFDEIS